MIDRTYSIVINRQPSEVFAYATDPQKTSEWDPKVLSVRVDPPGELAAGSKIVQNVRTGLGTTEGSFTVIDYQPGIEATYRSDNSYFTGDIIFRVQPEGDGTMLTIHEVGGSTGLLRLAGPLLARFWSRDRERMMARMKERLEAA